MQTILRVIVLSAFAAAGVGLAVSLALHADLAAVFRPEASSPGASVAAAEPAVESNSAPAPAPTPRLPASPRAAADWQPAVTQQTQEGQILDLLQRVRNEQSEVLDAARQLLNGPPQDEGSAAVLTQPAPTGPASPPTPGPTGPLPAPATRTAPPLDVVALAEAGRFSINIREATMREVLEALGQQTSLSIIASPTAGAASTPETRGNITASLNNVDVLTALDMLVPIAGFAWQRDGNVIFVGTPEEVRALSLAKQQMSVRVYRPNYVTAAELQKLIAPLLSATGQATVTTNTAGAAIATSTATQRGIAASADQTGGDDFAGSEVLLIRDYNSVLHYVEQVIQEVDRKPLQVSLEAMILSVRLNDENDRGVNLELLRNENNSRLISGVPLTDLAAINVTDGGLKFAFLDSSVSAFINALETIGDTNVIASPRLMCLNKQRAEILIGSQLGYVSTTVTETSATQSVSFLEVGTQLRFRPFISSDGTIRLEVHPELSTGNVRIEQGFTLPDKEVTQVTTNIMCHDGLTIIIGGLIREDLGNTVSQIPLLGNLPYVGFMFRQKNERTERREIIVLITPRLVGEVHAAYEGQQAKYDFLERQENFADKMSVIGKRHYGLRYLRLARAAWNAGDAPVALRYVNLALHFDPQNIEATTLRRDITQAIPPEVDNIHDRLRQGLTPWTMPAKDYSREGVEWRTTQPSSPVAPAEHLDISQPGPSVELVPYRGP